MTIISVIVGSTRQSRFSEKPAQWIIQHLKKRNGIEARLLDLRDFPMPFFDQAVPPAMPGRAPYEHEVVKRWTAASRLRAQGSSRYAEQSNAHLMGNDARCGISGAKSGSADNKGKATSELLAR
jgi:hypothetical protein